MQVWSLGWEDALDKEMATHSSMLAWRIPRAEEPGGLQPVWSQESDMNKHACQAKCQKTNTTLSIHYTSISSVQSLSCVWLFETPWTAALQASLSFTISQSLLQLMPIESVMPSNHFILCYPLLILPLIFLSIRVSSNESALHIKWSKYWSFSFSLSPSNEHPGLNSFRVNWLNLLVVQGTLKSLLQYHSWWNNRQDPNWKRRMSRLYIVTLLI